MNDYDPCLPTKQPVPDAQELFVLICQLETAEGFLIEPTFVHVEKMVANLLNQSYTGCVRSEDMPQRAISPSMGALLALTNETRANRTSAWKRYVVHGTVENEQAFVFGIKGRRSAGQLETAARVLGIFTGLLVGRRIALS